MLFRKISHRFVSPLVRSHIWILLPIGSLMAMVGCGHKANPSDAIKEDAAAKKMLQGIWLNDDADDVAFRVQGDTIYYPDSTSQPVYFYIYSDTLVMKGANEVKYPIVKQAPHLFEFKTQGGDIVKLVKTADKTYLNQFVEKKTVPLNQKTLIKRDTVIEHSNDRYHLYVQVNPTSFKVYKSDYNDDGVQVDNVYYDNIVNINIFKGASKLYSHDFHKGDFTKKVPESFLKQAILSDMVFSKVDQVGIHYLAILAMPDSSLSYQVEVVVTYAGKMQIHAVGA